MNKLDELRDVLNEYSHIFQNISKHENNAYPCMDLINEPDFSLKFQYNPPQEKSNNCVYTLWSFNNF